MKLLNGDVMWRMKTIREAPDAKPDITLWAMLVVLVGLVTACLLVGVRP